MPNYKDLAEEFQTFLAHVHDDYKTSHLTDQELEIKEICEKSLYEFVKHAWPALSGSGFIDGWHIEAICAHLEALYDLEITDLIINQPFRTGKSMLGAVFFPAWGFTQDPGQSFLFTSYSQRFATRDSIATRRLMQSDWYQRLWGHEVQLRRDMSNKLQFETMQGGYRLSSSVDAANTGGGANFICLLFDNLIQTSKGEVSIGKIVEEELDILVLSYNHDTNKLEYQPIVAYGKRQANELMEIELDDGTILECTPEHPIYVDGKGYIPAKDIQEEDELLSID